MAIIVEIDKRRNCDIFIDKLYQKISQLADFLYPFFLCMLAKQENTNSVGAFLRRL